MVHGFTTADGAAYGPGDIVDLPETYEGEAWLERVDDPAKAVAPPSKLEPLIPEKFVETKEKPQTALEKRRKGRNTE